MYEIINTFLETPGIELIFMAIELVFATTLTLIAVLWIAIVAMKQSYDYRHATSQNVQMVTHISQQTEEFEIWQLEHIHHHLN